MGPARHRQDHAGARIADLTKAEFISFSAVLAGIKEVKEVMATAEQRRRMTGKRTIVFVDEIHRFNKAQQDAFLPRVESGDIVLDRRDDREPVVRGQRRAAVAIESVRAQAAGRGGDREHLEKTLTDVERGLGRENPEADDDALGAIARFANGDARAALNLLQMAVASAKQPAGRPRINQALLEKTLQNRMLLYDKSGEEHYNLMSALHKSMRNSDADASIYWLARMVEAGEDPKYIARRLIRFASEDIGNADPQAMSIAVAAKDAVHFIGMPEGNTALAQCVLYLATAPKSNAVYMAYNDAAEAAKNDVASPVPLHLRNAPTKLMKQLDYGKGYRYAHEEPDAVANMDCLPENLKGREFYKPTDYGFEKEITKRLAWWKSKRK